MLCGVLECLQTEEVRRTLHRARITPDAAGQTVVASGLRSAAARIASTSPRSSDAGLMPTRTRADLVRGVLHVVAEAAQAAAPAAPFPCPFSVCSAASSSSMRRATSRCCAPVVQVALDPPALVICGCLDPRRRFPHRTQQRRRLRREPVVLERHHGVRGDHVDERAIVVQRRVVHDRRDPAAPVGDVGHGAPVPGRRRTDRLPVRSAGTMLALAYAPTGGSAADAERLPRRRSAK